MKKRGFEAMARGLAHPAAALLWLLTLLAALAWTLFTLARGYSFDSSILALLPESRSPDYQLSEAADRQLSEMASQRVIFLIGHNEAEGSRQAAEAFAAALDRHAVFAKLERSPPAQALSEWREHFFAHRYHLLSSDDQALLAQSPPDPEHPLLRRALARLYSPMASALAPTLVQDPLQLFYQWQLAAAPRTPFAVEGGWLTRQHEGSSWRLLVATLAGNPYALDTQQRFAEALAGAKAQLPADARLLSAGLIVHASHGAQQARQEISTIGLGSLIGISLLLLYCFRRLRSMLLAFLPIACGWLFALAGSLALFSQLHLITLAFGASLIGVAIDYSLHFLSARQQGAQGQESGSVDRLAANRRSLLDIMPAITLGLVSSALAYAAQGLAPFPGLRQMAVFSVLGLLGAWLTVTVWLPWLAPAASERERGLRSLARRIAALLARWPRVESPALAASLIALLLASGWQLSRLDFDDDLRSLQTSPSELLAEDARVQALTRGLNPGQYFLISAPSPEQLLQAEERLRPSLDRLRAAGQIYDYQALSRWLPSRQQQAEHYRLNRTKVFAPEGLAPALARQLGSPELAEPMRAAFADSEREDFLSLSDWLASPAGQQQEYLWLGERQGQFHSLVLISGLDTAQTLQELARFAKIDDRIRFVDKVEQISTVLAEHRSQLQLWILLAYAAVLALLSLRYGRASWRLLAAPAIASLFSLAVLSALGFGVNIFNLLALLLVLGIGLDAGIFLRESAQRERARTESARTESARTESAQKESAGRASKACSPLGTGQASSGAAGSEYAWTAVSLAACTTLLAFGLLALSATPVLQHFGVTLLLGIVGVWCLAPCFVRLDRPKPKFDNGNKYE